MITVVVIMKNLLANYNNMLYVNNISQNNQFYLINFHAKIR